ncbi:hypothetical protein LR48_Vigan01g157700 [Vigna angularis]|uniref:Uncharacterized protein n=1 Tax=Phaseolus angularis TaxID=3914 RepID=A0A0L9TNJ3_PHAAN|nr:hypothetical protein LR48_Vigan01g157700 [Vigna angularis]
MICGVWRNVEESQVTPWPTTARSSSSQTMGLAACRRSPVAISSHISIKVLHPKTRSHGCKSRSRRRDWVPPTSAAFVFCSARSRGFFPLLHHRAFHGQHRWQLHVAPLPSTSPTTGDASNQSLFQNWFGILEYCSD